MNPEDSIQTDPIQKETIPLESAAIGPVLPPSSMSAPEPPVIEPAETRFLKSILFGPTGVRVGWLVALFVVLTLVFAGVLGTILQLALQHIFHLKIERNTPQSFIFFESLQTFSLLGAAFVCALIERRHVMDYNLSGPSRVRHFFTGMVGGFIALSALVGALYAGGWLQVGAVALSGLAILQFGLLWGIAFLGTGLSEEGISRCYMLYTLTRGINFWWALGSVSTFCALALINPKGNGSGGVYLMAALGVLPCLLLHLKKSPAAGFWQASWLTSTLFGYVHTSNDGETWIGIFSAAAIGFVFCVSVRVTGSAWWAIGFHAAWDWAQTFFYGTADSGFAPKGHYLTTTPAGPMLWSGGSDGPEGSLLVIPTVLLVLLALIVIYGRRRTLLQPSPDEPQIAA